MSLFASAFDTAGGPSNISSPALGKSHKDGKKSAKPQKRNSLGRPDKPDLRATEQNLAKLMKRVEAGEIKEKRGGGENMGMGGRQGKGKGKGRREDGDKQDEGFPPSHVGAGQKRKRENEKNEKSDKNVKNEKNGKSTVTKPQSTPVKQGGKGGKPAPAEIPLPHIIPKSELHSQSVGDSNLTEMQKSMQAKLEGARFRWINEQLYSNPSTEAVAMMKKDPKIFEDYHQTHRALTSAWPSPPLPHLISLLSPLPAQTVIVDLGCGDAGLAKALVPQGKIVLSYDLVGDSGKPGQAAPSVSGGWVVEADFLQHVPLPGRPGGLTGTTGTATGTVDGEDMSKSKKRRQNRIKNKHGSSEMVDVVVCCLSLMGTNWLGGIYEACRVMKQGGTLHIAEVTSRFVSTESFASAIESFGFTLESEESPSTHFTLFKFTKHSDVPLGPARGEAGWETRVGEGERILRGCVYKKR